MRAAKVIYLFDISILIILLYALNFKFCLPLIYYLCIAILSLLTIFVFLRHESIGLLCVHVHLIYLILLRSSIYFMYYSFNIIPYGDAYWDYAVVSYFNFFNNIEAIRVSEVMPSFNLTWMSGWPAIHIVALVIYKITNMELIKIAIIIPLIFSIIIYLSCYLIFIFIFKNKDKGSHGLVLALIVIVTSPEVIFWYMQFKYQTIAIVFSILLFYVLIRYIYNFQPMQTRIVFILFIIALVMSHHIVSAVFVVYLALLFIFFAIGKEKISYALVALGMSFIFVWWSAYGMVIWPTIGSVIERLVLLASNIRDLEYLSGLSPFYPSSITPFWGILLLKARDFLMYVPAVLGFIIIVFVYPNDKTKKFYLVSSVIFAFIFLFNLVAIKIEPFRIVTYAMPFVAIATSFMYIYLNNRYRIFAALTALSVTIFIASSFLGFGSHNYVSLHFYDPKINHFEIGEHNPNYLAMYDFIKNKNPQSNARYIVSDDFPVLYLLFEPNQYSKYRLLKYESDVYNMGADTLCVIMRDFNFYSYAGSAAHTYYEKNIATEDHFSDLRKHAKYKISEKSKIYIDGFAKLYI